MRRLERIACGAVGAGVIRVALGSTAVPMAGCYTHQCDQSSYDFYGGRMVDDQTYETNAFDEPWLNYPANVTVRVHYPDVGRAPISIEPYIGISQLPNGPDANFTNGSGGLVEFEFLSSTGFWAFNTTCAGYSARFVVRFPAVPAGDGGADAMAEAADAGTDVATE